MKGPETSALRAARNSSAALRCSGVIFSTGIGGKRSCAAAVIGHPTASSRAMQMPFIVAAPLIEADPLRVGNSATQNKRRRSGANRRLVPRPGLAEDCGLLQVLAHQLGHREHVHGRLAAEDRLQLVIGVDLPLVLLVLQTVLLDVSPQLLGD